MYANMRQCDSKSLQNTRKRCFRRDSQYSMLRREQSSSFNSYIPMTLVHKREKSRKQCADLCEVGHRAVPRSRVRRCCKNLGFSWPVHSSLASSAKLDIVKVDKTQMVEIGWEPSDYSIMETSVGEIVIFFSYGKLYASSFLCPRNRELSKRIIDGMYVLQRGD